jgi:hypothetical protein
MWSNDATQNLVLAQSTTFLNGAYIRPRPDGGFYISWLDGGRGYSLYLQCLDENGNLLWDTAGKLVYERHITSTVDYRLSVDPDGNAIIGIDSGIPPFSPGGTALAFKLSPSGEMLWGDSGIAVSSPDEVIGQVRCAATSDRGAAFFWDSNSDARILHVVKLDANGNRAWVEDVQFSTSTGDIRPVEVIASDAGSVICAFVHQFGNSSLLTQKLASADGATMWGANPVAVVDAVKTNVTLPVRQDPTVLSDNAGGAIFGYPLADAAGGEMVYVQRIDTGGLPFYEANGLHVTTETLRIESTPCFGFSAADNLVYALWESSPTPSITDVRAQCIDATGSLLWGGSGVVLTAPVLNPAAGPGTVGILSVADGALAAWVPAPPTGLLPQPLRVSLLDKAGRQVWPGQSVDIKVSATTSTDNAGGTIGVGGYGAFVWTSDDYTCRAQNINMDGTLGVAT